MFLEVIRFCHVPERTGRPLSAGCSRKLNPEWFPTLLVRTARIGKDEIKPFATAFMNLNTSPRIGRHLSVLQFFHDFADESIMVAVFLYTDYAGHTHVKQARC